MSIWNILVNPVFDGVGLAGFYYNLLLFFPFSSFCLLVGIVGICGAGVFELIGSISLSLRVALQTFFNNNNNR